MSSIGEAQGAGVLPLSIVYLGLPLGALALARAGFAPRVICLGHHDAPGARRVRAGLGRHALVLAKPDLAAPGIANVLASVRPDVVLSWFWPRRIPEAVLALGRHGAFGVHPSLLPQLRGPDPYFWAIYEGHVATGVTLHRLAADYDTGAVIERRKLPIAPTDTGFKLAKKLDKPGLELLVSCAERLRAGDALLGEPQDDSLATQAPRPDDELLDVDWRAPADRLERLVRAAAPYPGARAELGDHVVELLEVQRYGRPLPRALEPADAVLGPEGVVVCTGQGGLCMVRVRLESGEVLRGRAIATLFEAGLATVS